MNTVTCSICLEDIELILDNSHSIQYISPISNSIELNNLSKTSNIEEKYISTSNLQNSMELQKNYLYPCKCTNPVHIKCILEWISRKNNTTCEICNTQYNIKFNIYQLNEFYNYNINENNYNIELNEINEINENLNIEEYNNGYDSNNQNRIENENQNIQRYNLYEIINNCNNCNTLYNNNNISYFKCCKKTIKCMMLCSLLGCVIFLLYFKF